MKENYKEKQTRLLIKNLKS